LEQLDTLIQRNIEDGIGRELRLDRERMDTLARSRGQLLFCTVTITTKLDTLNPKPKLKCLPADRPLSADPRAMKRIVTST
jgi:hypothetical protein